MMLFAIREKAKGWFAWFIVILISVPFALWGIGSYISPDPNPPVAEVDGIPITTSSFQSALQQKDQSAEINSEQQKQVVLQRLINNKALLSHLISQGYVISQANLDQQIIADKNFTDIKTGEFSQEQFNLTLRRMGITYSYYRSLLNDDLLIQQYLNAINYGNFVTPKEEENILSLLKQERDIDYVLISGEQFKDSINISDKEISDYYEQHKNEFETPEQVKVAYLEISRKALAKKIELTEEEIRQAYEDNKANYTTSEERQASHILITIDEKVNEAAAKEKIDAIYQRLQQNEDFAKLAKEMSTDTGSAESGGDLGYFTKGDMVPEFEKTAYALKINEISPPFKTDFGYHIVKLTGIKPEKIRLFSEVADKIKSDLQFEQAEKQYIKMSEELQTIAYEQPDSLEAAASAINQTIKYSPLFSRGNGDAIFSQPKVNAAAFSDLVLEEGNNSDLIELENEHVLVIRLAQRIEAQIKTLEQVSQQIKDIIKTTKLADKTYEIAQQLEKAAKTSKEDLDTLLTQYKLTIEKKGFVERGSQDVPITISNKAFRLARMNDNISVSTVKTGQESSALVIVNGIKEGDLNDITIRDGLSTLLNRSISTLLTNLSVSQITRQSDIKIFSERMNAE
ncbi:MAG: peptidylprolyl isomerase [Gammaproteobacteria bacterium]|nr:peptidylprolyl isomerase [Gammaproteobacteria bacterium]